jgi:hypothetical protein
MAGVVVVDWVVVMFHLSIVEQSTELYHHFN